LSSHLTFKCELLEGIGAISKVEGKKAVMHSGNYQDNMTTSLACKHDNDAASNNNDKSVDINTDIDAADVNAADSVLPAIERVSEHWTHSSPAKLNILVSFRKSSRLSAQAPNIVNHGLGRSSLCSSKGAGH